MRKLLLIKAGDMEGPLRASLGSHDRWFHPALAKAGFSLLTVSVHLGEKLPKRPGDAGPIVVSGSPHSMTEPTDWMLRVADFLREAAVLQVPTLGVCFGLHLLGHAFGAQVVRNPRGREIGSVEIFLTDAGAKDPLFLGVPRRFWAQATHEDILDRTPKTAETLAQNAQCPLQALAFGEAVRAVQFHPELSAAAVSAIISSRAPKLGEEAARRGEVGSEAVRRLLAGVSATPAGPKILENFLSRFAR